MESTKKRLKDGGNETVTNCHALKLKAKDGKYRITDVVGINGVVLENDNSRNYWKGLKHKLKQEGNQLVTNCDQLKLES